MYDAKDLLKIVKQAAMDAVMAANPVAICTGAVAGETPLQIKLGTKLMLTGSQLVKCKGIGELKKKDQVILLREQGGQKYIILGVI